MDDPGFAPVAGAGLVERHLGGLGADGIGEGAHLAVEMIEREVCREPREIAGVRLERDHRARQALGGDHHAVEA